MILQFKIIFFFLNQAPKGTLAWKLYEKRNRADLCFLIEDNKQGNLVKRPLDKIFSSMPDLYSNLLTLLIHKSLRKDTFISDFSLFQTVRAFIVRRNIRKETKQFLNVWFVFLVIILIIFN